MIVLFSIVALLAIIVFFYMRQAKFGKLPSGERLARVERSPHFKNGQFQNLAYAPMLSEGYSMPGVIFNSLFTRHPRQAPVDSIPSVKTDLKNLPPGSNVLVWFGHSSFFLQLDGIKILADPVFSGNASPIPGFVRAYKGSDIYQADDMPSIDYLLLSHDHYDHLDYETITALKSKIKHVICGLGAGAHFEYWGYTPDQIIEKDWYEKVEVAPGYNIFTESTQHFSGRGFTRGKALWLSFMIQSPSMKIYYTGDGGYDNRFVEIGKKYNNIDWAIMEDGQYNKAWESVHNLPEQVAQAALDLHVKNIVPVHNSKFTLANHPWDEPLKEITALSKGKPYRLATPMIGEVVRLNDPGKSFTEWWRGVK